MIGVDLSRARFESVDERGRTAIILLALPSVTAVNLDQNRTKVIGLNSTGLWMIVPGGSSANVAAVNLSFKEADRVVREAANDPALIRQAQRQAEMIIHSFAVPLDCSIEIRWDE